MILTTIVDLTHNHILPNQGFRRFDGGQGNATKSMDVDILSCQEKILDFGKDRHLRKHQIAAILLETIARTAPVAIVIADGER